MHTSSILLLLSTLLFTLSHAAFNLTTIEAIPQSYVTPKCWDAYNTPIPGCQYKTACNDTCVASVRAADPRVRNACKGNFVHMESILQQILDGGMMYVVCPAYSKTAVQIVESTMYYMPGTTSSVLALDLAPSPTIPSGVYFAGTETAGAAKATTTPVESATGRAGVHSAAVGGRGKGAGWKVAVAVVAVGWWVL
ncbi:hypothetical protein K440DRAFT_624071 [Wilcoxina mikolae CBS 423.85]|nr:hypothetical protein K440DRAFT_624071 [Wilcoxina mikolae CBS 423.85]